MLCCPKSTVGCTSRQEEEVWNKECVDRGSVEQGKCGQGKCGTGEVRNKGSVEQAVSL